jgi:hypothetical protein
VPDSKFDLGDYVEVKDRIPLFYLAFPEGRLCTGEVRISVDDDTPRVIVQALAYRTPDDPHPGVGWSWMELPGRTSYTKGSELENAETSAWGRAIAATGIGLGKSIASANEIRAKAGEDIPPTDPAEETLRPLGPIEREGALAKGSGRHSDGEWREDPDGTRRIGFLLEVGDGKARPQVLIEGALGSALFATGEALVGVKVNVTGELFEVHAPKRKTMYRIVATRIQTPDWTMPADEAHQTPVEPEPAAVALPDEAEAELAALPW